MKGFGFIVLLTGVIALSMNDTSAEAQLFRGRRQNIQVNAGNTPVQVKVTEPRRGLLQRLFNRQPAVTEINVGQPTAFIRQQPTFIPSHQAFTAPPTIVVHNGQALRAPAHIRFQTDQLNTYTTVHNAPANIRFSTQQYAYVQPQQQLVAAPIVVQRQYALPPQTYQITQQVQVQEYTQPCDPTVAAAPVMPPADPSTAPAPTDPSVQYQTMAPSNTRTIQRVVTVQRPVAITGNGVYMSYAPARLQQYTQHCN